MSDFKPGDKVRVKEEMYEHLPHLSSKKDMQAVMGTLTVEEVVTCPTTEDPQGQAVWFEGLWFTAGSEMIERVA